MKNKMSYIVMSLLFFNLFFVFNYYFKIVDFLYIDFLFSDRLIQIIFVNGLLIVVDAFYIFLYGWLRFYKLSYFSVVLLGLIVGVISSLFIFRGEYSFSNYLAIVSYSIINMVFIYYSLYFERYKDNVFE